MYIRFLVYLEKYNLLFLIFFLRPLLIRVIQYAELNLFLLDFTQERFGAGLVPSTTLLSKRRNLKYFDVILLK